MGVDLSGSNGNYFRNNVWWWYPLWNYVCDVGVSFITDEDRTGGSYNDGYFVPPSKARQIAEILGQKIESGECAVHAACLPKLYQFSVENVANFVEFCAASGGFVIW